MNFGIKNILRASIICTQFVAMPQAHGSLPTDTDMSFSAYDSQAIIKKSTKISQEKLPDDKYIIDITDRFPYDKSPYKVIYGEDDRYDREEYPDALFRQKASSVAGMVSRKKLVKDFFDKDLRIFFKKTAMRQYGLCEDEQFATQNILPTCSGFLIDEQHLVTAGHCFRTKEDCDNFVWVFDYVEGTKKIKTENIYSCSEIKARELKNTYFTLRDYMVIKLDRPVLNREPLEFRTKGRPNYGEELVIIGHPLGLPQKIADGAEVKIGKIQEDGKPIRNLIKKRDYFMANVDAFIGNSGSPVLNRETGLVEGILIEGAEDFKDDLDNLCSRSVRKTDQGLQSEEKVFRINRIPFLESLSK